MGFARRPALSLMSFLLVILALGTTIPTSALAHSRAGSVDRSGGVAAAAFEEDDNIPGHITDDDSLWYADGTMTYPDTLSASDTDDVYAVWMWAGEVLDLSLTVPALQDPGLYLFDPDAVDIYTDPYRQESHPSLAGEHPGAVTTSLEAPASGYYYVDVYMPGEGGAYSLTMTLRRRASDVRIPNSGATLPYGGYPTIRGDVVNARYSSQEATGNLVLYYSFDARDWAPLAAQRYAGGTFVFNGLNQWRKTYYMVTLESDAFTSNSQVTSRYATRVSLTTPYAPATMRKGRARTVYGFLMPRHAAGRRPVRIYKQKRVNGRWRDYGYVKATASTVNTSTSKYAARVSFPSAGAWRVWAHAPADSRHAPTSTRCDYITVK